MAARRRVTSSPARPRNDSEAAATNCAASGDASALPALPESMAGNGIELVSLHERPEMAFPSSYVYLIECANAGYAEFAALAATEGFECRCCGAFPVKPLRRLIKLQTRSSRMAA